MKRFFGFALVGLMATSAYAGSLTLDGRFDYGNTTVDDANQGSGTQVTRLKMDGQGSAGKAKFRARFDLNGDTATVNDGDGTTDFVDFAYMGTEVANGWDLNIGRIILGMGGAEAMNNPGDNHMRSVAGEELSDVYWQGGIQAVGKVGEGKLNISYANNSVAHAIPTTGMVGLAWSQKMGDITPVISYHTEKFAAGAAAYDNKFMAVGLKWSSGMWDVELDYLDNKYDETEMASGLGVGTASHTNSIPVLVRYKMGDASVQFKYEMSKVEAAAGDNEVKGMALVYESNDVKKDMFRWHAGYTQKDVTPDGADAVVTKSVFVGMRVLADILK